MVFMAAINSSSESSQDERSNRVPSTRHTRLKPLVFLHRESRCENQLRLRLKRLRANKGTMNKLLLNLVLAAGMFAMSPATRPIDKNMAADATPIPAP